MNSTGPKTDEGKKTSRLNAYKHGLTGQILALTGDEQLAYEALCKSYRDLYKPVGLPEEALVQCIADDYFRALRGRAIEINQIRVIENAMAGEVTTLKPGSEKMLGNIALYLQRIERSIKNNTKALQEMQSERKAAEQADRKAVAQPAGNPQPSATSVDNTFDHLAAQGFVFSNSQIAHLRKEIARVLADRQRTGVTAA